MERIDERNTCPACGGSGVQRNIQTGLYVICPVCDGTGKWKPVRPFPEWEGTNTIDTNVNFLG